MSDVNMVELGRKHAKMGIAAAISPDPENPFPKEYYDAYWEESFPELGKEDETA